MRISSQRSALCLLFTANVWCVWDSSHRLREHNDFLTWIKDRWSSTSFQRQSNSAALRYPCGARQFLLLLSSVCLFFFLFALISLLFILFFSLHSVFVKMLFHTYMLHPKMFESFSATLVLFDSLPLIWDIVWWRRWRWRRRRRWWNLLSTEHALCCIKWLCRQK